MQKRCLTIQDYSCLGRCSLTVALPVLSAAGIEACGIPTAVLSNHTAGFKSWTYADLTDYINPTVDHWKDYRHHFDAIYTGYLGTNQVSIISSIIDKLKAKDTVVIVDPACADNGKLYPGFSSEHITAMKRLIKRSDIILPNLTEATLLADETYSADYDELMIKHLLMKLSRLGPKQVVISGLSFTPNTIGCYSYDADEDVFDYYQTEAYPGTYHGTGDLFASTFVASILNGFDMKGAVRIAHDIVHQAIAETIEDEGENPEIYYGVEFEKALPTLISRVSKRRK